MRPLTSVDPKVLQNLTPNSAVDIFRELLWSEAAKIGLGPASISVPCAISVSDGGVDAEVGGAAGASPGGLIFEGVTRYQIKTGGFAASSKSDFKQLFLNEDCTDFKPRVRTCFEKGGTFVAVLFGSDLPDRTDDEAAQNCREFVSNRAPQFANCKIRVLRQNQIAGLLSRYPALALKVQFLRLPGMSVHREWRDEIESRMALKLGPKQEGLLKQIQDELRRPEVVKHICVWGEPGVGKTRLLYEATAAEDLAPLILYFRSPDLVHQSGVIDEIKRDETTSAILVVDDCDPRDRQDVWNQLKALGPRVRLISVQHDPCDSSGMTVALQAPQLPDEQISEIVQEYGVRKETADRYASFCGGSPRVAEVLGWNLQHHPDDLTRPRDTGDVWSRYIEGTDDPHSEAVAQRKLVLQHISLFKRFGFGAPFQSEARSIAQRVQAADPAITWPRFEDIVHTLRKRRILQGDTTLYVTPRLLHIKLWCDWWDVHGENFDLRAFLKAIPASLHAWFYEMFAYAYGSEAASSAVRRILSRHGSFVKDGLLKTELGANFFLNLTEADTESALECIEATIGTETRDELLQFSAGRQRVVWALEKIAVERALFGRAARLLLRLAEAENNPRIANNASGTFADLFSLGPGRTAPTQAPPAERFPVLIDALDSGSKEQRAVALRACDQALRHGQFSRTYGAERRGLKDLELWSPKTYGEWFQAYAEAWDLLRQRIPNLESDEQVEAAGVLLKNSFGLVQIDQLAGMVTETISELVKVPSIPRKLLLETVIDVLERLDKLPVATRERWRQIETEIVGGDDFRARLRRYVGIPAWRLQLRSKSDGDLLALAQEAVNSPERLEAELGWLMSSEAEGAHTFGYHLGSADSGFTCERRIIEAARKTVGSGAIGLLGGYLRAVHERNPSHWLSLLNQLSNLPNLRPLMPDVISHSGLNDEAAAILVGLVKNKHVPAARLGYLLGPELRQLSVPMFCSWIELLLLDGSQSSVVTALNLLHHFYYGDEGKAGLPKELTEAVLLHERLFQAEAVGTRGVNIDYDWAEVAKRFLQQYPDRKLALAKKMLEALGNDSIVMQRVGHSYTTQVLTGIAKEMPMEVWGLAAPLLGPPIDSHSYSVSLWLKGGSLFADEENEGKADSVLSYVPLEEVWKWVDQDVDKRAWYLAGFVPKVLFIDPSRPCLAREVLIRYGHREDVQSSLAANFSTAGWWGPESLHHKSRREALQAFLQQEDNPRVREWLNKYVEHLQRDIDRARIMEERED